MRFFVILLLLPFIVAFGVYISPIVIGVVIISLVNIICKLIQGRIAPTWWHIPTVVATVCSTAMFWRDISDENVDTLPPHLLILIGYGLVFCFLISIITAIKQGRYNQRTARNYNSRRSSKTPMVSTPIKKPTQSKSSAHQRPQNADVNWNISAEKVLNTIHEIYVQYEEAWCDDECILLLDDYSMAIATYPNPELPLPEIMKQTASCYTKQMGRILPLTNALEKTVYQLNNCESFTPDELDSIAELYDDFTSLADSLIENYNSISDMTLSIKSPMEITNVAVVNAKKFMISAFEEYCTSYKTILATHSAMNKNLYNILKSNRKATLQTNRGSITASTLSESGSSLLARVRKNLTVDSKIFDQYGLTFRCNLVDDYGTLQLNYELSNTKQLLSQIGKGTDLTLKANVYDTSNNLLCIEESWIEYNQLKSGYAAAFFYFSSDSMSKANSIRVYAIDPKEENYDEEEDAPSIKSDNMNQFLLDESLASRYNEILSDSLKLIGTTTTPKTFFGRYDDALTFAHKIISTTHSDGHKAYAQEIIDDLQKSRDTKCIGFIDRCNQKGTLYSIKDELLSGQYDISSAVIEYINNLITEIENERADAPTNGEYIYCSLSFGSEGKTYYYKTTDKTLKCGDEVIVPVGNEGRKGIAKIVKIETFKVGETPFPPSRTKSILGKCKY